MRYSTPTESTACTSTTVASREARLSTTTRGGSCTGVRLARAAVHTGALGQPGLQGQSALEHPLEVGDDLVPGDGGPEARLDPEHLEGDPVEAGDRRVEHRRGRAAPARR